jgi:hypothetical protein
MGDLGRRDNFLLKKSKISIIRIHNISIKYLNRYKFIIKNWALQINVFVVDNLKINLFIYKKNTF